MVIDFKFPFSDLNSSTDVMPDVARISCRTYGFGFD